MREIAPSLEDVFVTLSRAEAEQRTSNPQANHAELHVYLIGPDGKLEKDKDGKPHPYGVEMAGAAAVAEQGITAETMKAGTIVSVKVNPLRDGTDFGSKAGNSAVAKCPWKTPPAPGMTCDTVAGHELLGYPKF